MDYQLLQNIHEKLELPSEAGKSFLAKEPYFYYHYKCDGTYDVVRKDSLVFYLLENQMITLSFLTIIWTLFYRLLSFLGLGMRLSHSAIDLF